MSNQFRIGGVYRIKCGGTILLTADGRNDRRAPDGFAGMLLQNSGGYLYQFTRLADGCAVDDDDLSQCGTDTLDLIPGELAKVGDEYVPIEQEPAQPQELKSQELTRDIADAVFDAARRAHAFKEAAEAAQTALIASDDQHGDPECVQQLRDLVAIQGENGNWNSDDYSLGLFNGLELALATMEGREPAYRTLTQTAAPVSTAKPALPALTILGDVADPRHGSAWLIRR